MSTRRRAGTWQDEVARSFSRLFSRTSSQEKEEESGKDPGEEQDRGDKSLSRLFFRSSSQEKKDGSDKTEHEEEQERSHSPSRLFFRKVSQENKGDIDNASPAKGNKEEQDRSKGFSRLFTRTSSQEKEEDSDSSRGAREDKRGHEDNHSTLTCDRHEELSSSSEPEQVTLEQTSSPPLHHVSEPEEEKDGEFTHDSKVLDSEKQSRENFFHFIGNLFHFSPKSSLGNSKQGVDVQETCKEHEDAQVKNNLDKEDLNQGRTLDHHSGTEEPSEQNTAQHDQEKSVSTGGEITKDVLEHSEDAAAPKLNGHAQDAPAITYGTYRGSRRIRKLLKRRADVNSPIPEKEETTETSSVVDATTENCLMLHEVVKMEPVPDRNCQDEIPPSKIHIKMQSKLEPLDQNARVNLSNNEHTIQKAKNLKVTNDLEIESTDVTKDSNSVEVNAENSSGIVEGQQPKIEDYVTNVPQLNAKESSEILQDLQPNTGESLEDLHPTIGEGLNILGNPEQNVENSGVHSKQSTILRTSEPNNEGHYTDVESKTVEVSDSVRSIQPNSDEASKQPEDLHPDFQEIVSFPEILQTSIDEDSRTETDPFPKIADNFNSLLNTKEHIEDFLTEQGHANTDISHSDKYETFSVMDNSRSGADDTLVRSEGLEENSEENTKVPVDLGSCVATNMQNDVQQSPLDVEDKPCKDPPENSPQTPHNRSENSSDKNGEDFNATISDYLKREVERSSNTQLVPSNTVDIETDNFRDSTIGKQIQLYGNEYLKQPNWELNSTVKSLSEYIPNLDLQLNETSRTSEDVKQIENKEHIQKNANIVAENPEKDEQLLQPNTKVTFQLKESPDEFPSGIISKVIENQKPNLHIVSNVSHGIQPEVEEPSKVDLCLETNSEVHDPDITDDSLVHTVSQLYDFLCDEAITETSHSNSLADEDNILVDKHDVAVKEFYIKPAIINENPDNVVGLESCLNDHSSFNKNLETGTARNISFDNGIECRSPSPPSISDSPSYADCIDVQFDSPNDSGIVSSQAYTPDEHIPFQTFPSETHFKNAPSLFELDQKSKDASETKPDTSVNLQTVPALQNKEPMIHIENVSKGKHESVIDRCASNSGSDVSIEISTPDKLVHLNSDVYVAKVSVKTVNIEEVKISPHGLRSDIISVAKLESPNFEKEIICIPNLSPADAEHTFQVFHCAEDDKDFTNIELPNDREENLTVNNCEEQLKNCYLETEELTLSNKYNDVSMKIVNALPDNQISDCIPQYTCIEKESPKISDKSPEVLIENFKNNNINVCTSDNIINVDLQAHKSERELSNEALMSSDSLRELRLGESLSELNPDSKMNHKENLSVLLFNSTLLHDATEAKEIISSCSATEKIILPSKDHSESSNKLFEQKSNENIFSVLHSAMDELQYINQSCINKISVKKNTLTDIKIVIENLSGNHKDLCLKDHPTDVLYKCPDKTSDHILIEDTDLIMSMAVGIVNDVISSSKQLVVSNIIPNGLSKDITKNETTQQKTTNDLNGLCMDNLNGPVEDATNSNHIGSSLGYDNVVPLPSCEINSNVLQVGTEVSQTAEPRQVTGPSSLNELGSRVTVEMSGKAVDRTMECNVLTKIEDKEHLCFSGSSIKADTYNQINENYANEDLVPDDLYYDGQIESTSLRTEGSMDELIYDNNICEESGNSSEFSDLLQFSVYNSRYVEVSGSDDESTDEENDSGSEQAAGNDSFLTVQSRRVRMYPFALSPIYEDDSACEDTLSNSSSPRYNEGSTASNSSHDHTSILSLLQSVSDRLKEADLEETSCEERLLSLSNDISVNDRFNKEGSEELEDIISPSKTSLDAPSPPDQQASVGKRSGLFITKSCSENKPNPVLGRQSFLLNLTSHSDIYGAKYSVESSFVPSSSIKTSVSPTSESNPNQSTDLSPSTAAVHSLSSDPALPIQSFAADHKPRSSPKSVYYQYFHSAQNYLSNTENNESHAQEKLEEQKKTGELDMNPADSDVLKFNPRPGKVILTDIIDQGNKIELKTDILDATSWVFPNGVNIRVIRGCWILYEKTHFEGQAHVLEEGEAVLRHLWDLSGANTKPDKITIGSVKRVLKDYLPEVVISSLQDVSDSPIYIRTEVPSLENLVGKHPRSLVVNSGVWLAYTEPQYNGTVTVLEEGCELPQIQDSSLKSMRPLKMGGLKVQLPSDPKIIIYEEPHFQGWSREITEHVSSIGTLLCDGENSSSQEIGSVQVIGGIWVGYENERYKGHQYLLEEGDYEDWHAWGGFNNTLQSIQYLQADFLESSVTLFETDEEDGKQINLFNKAIPDLELAGYNKRTQCIHVKKGMWVAYQQKHFCGEQYVLEKGRYKTFMDWGGSNNTIMSIRPVLLEPLGRNDVKHLIKAYTSDEFQGETTDFTQGVSDFTSFRPMSLKVLRGCWLLCYEADTCANLCVLEEGHFPDLASCVCPTAEIKYIKPIDYVFAEPSVSLFALDSCEGRELHFEEAVTSVLSKDLHFSAQSVWVRRGLWIAFEGANFFGRQMLLDPQQIVNWSQFSGWKAIGSLRPLKQPSVYFMVKNRHKDKYLTVTGKLTDTRATFVSVSSRNGQTTQIWYFCRGFLKSKANDSCLDVIGGKNIPGSKVSLWAEHGKTRQKWKINKDGTISSYISDDLVLDLKGGNYYDQNYIVVNKVGENILTQKWDIEIL
ncbi:very large A-kinase anchor protein [Rhinoderma darwinii]|uniref:very large A-kinase anchor protein n=1 Tax=Rhinoderma darwinii TaxID=43563 RepID=UPI003F661CC5